MSYKEEELEVLSGKMDQFAHTLYAAQMKKFEHVLEVYDTEHLSGMNLEELLELLSGMVDGHVDEKTVNIHEITPESLGSYNSEHINDNVDRILDDVSTVPLSYYGDRNYIPDPFAMEHRHFIHDMSDRSCVHLIEHDGTWVGLHNSTDGSNPGVSWLYSVMAQTSYVTKVTRTSITFNPHYIGSKEEAYRIYGDKNFFFLHCGPEKTGNINKTYAVLTNGTLNPEKHTVSTVTVPTELLYKPFTTVIHGGLVYLVYPDDSSFLGYSVYSISVSSLSGSSTTVYPVTGWKNTRPSIGTTTDTKIIVAPTKESILIESGKKINLIRPSQLSPPLIMESDVPGKFYLLSKDMIRYRPNDGMSSDMDIHLSIASLVNFSNKIVDHPSIYGSDKATVSYSGTTISIVEKGIHSRENVEESIWNEDRLFDDILFPTYVSSNVYSRVLFSNDDPNRAYLRVSSFDKSNTKSSIVIDNVPWAGDGDNVKIPTNLHGSLDTPMGLISSLGNVTILHQSIRDGLVTICRLNDSSTNHEYGNPMSKSRVGFSKTDYKVKLSELNPSVDKLRFITSEVSETNQQNNHGCGITFLKTKSDIIDREFTKFHSISNSGILTKSAGSVREHTFSFDRNELVENILQELNEVDDASERFDTCNVTLICSKLLGSDKSILVSNVLLDIVGSSTSKQMLTLSILCNVTMSGDEITNVTLIPSSKLISSRTTSHLEFTDVVSNNVIRRISGGNIVYGITPYGYKVNGEIKARTMFLRLSNNKLSLVGEFDRNDSIGSTPGFINFPSQGMYYYNSGPTITPVEDGYLKKIGVKLSDLNGSNILNLNALNSQINTGDGSHVLLSTEAVNHWTAYIVHDVDCMINGVAGVVEKETFLLDDIADQWGEWMLWLRRTSDGEFNYNLIQESENQPDDDHLYLGYMHTKNKRIGVFTTYAEKSVAIGGYRLSKWKAGKSFGHSEGPVISTKHLNWV